MRIETGNGRARLRRDNGSTALRIEWALGRKACAPGISIGIDNEEDATVSVRIPFASLFVSWPVSDTTYERWVARAQDVGARRWDGVDIVDVRAHDGSIWWSFLHPQGSWTSGTPRWRNGNANLVDVLLGARKYTSETVETRNVQIPMPEGAYNWTIELTRDSWKRPRWPGALTIVRARADAKQGEQIPIPGKGENAWDCGADALHGTCFGATTIEEAIAGVVASVLRDRQRRGDGHAYVEGGKYDPQRVEAA